MSSVISGNTLINQFSEYRCIGIDELKVCSLAATPPHGTQFSPPADNAICVKAEGEAAYLCNSIAR